MISVAISFVLNGLDGGIFVLSLGISVLVNVNAPMGDRLPGY
jgi:hypothetical protein